MDSAAKCGETRTLQRDTQGVEAQINADMVTAALSRFVKGMPARTTMSGERLAMMSALSSSVRLPWSNSSVAQ